MKIWIFPKKSGKKGLFAQTKGREGVLGEQRESLKSDKSSKKSAFQVAGCRNEGILGAILRGAILRGAILRYFAGKLK